MTSKEITIAGKTVSVAYCYATEIGFHRYTGKNLDEFDATDPEHVTYLIISAILSYYQGRDEEPPVKDEDLMYQAKPKELIEAMAAIFKLRAEWYELPVGEPKDEAKGEPSKNG